MRRVKVTTDPDLLAASDIPGHEQDPNPIIDVDAAVATLG